MNVFRKTSAGFFKTVVRVTIYLVLIIILFYAGRTAYTYGQKVFSEEGVEEEPGTDVTLVVSNGMSVRALGSMLKEYGVIDDTNIFYLQSLIFEVSEVQPGTYTFNTSQSGEEILGTVSAGPVVADSEDAGETEDTNNTEE